MTEVLNESIPRSFRNLSTTYSYNEYFSAPTTKRSYSVTKWTETRQGIQNPRWRSQVLNHEEAGTAYVRNGRVNFTPGRISFRLFHPNFYGYSPLRNSYTESLSRTWLELPSSAINPLASVYNTALGNFLTNINDALSPFKGMTFVGELRETLRMLRRPASSLRDGFSAYFKRARREAGHRASRPKIRKILGDLWLEYSYGWIPLIGDIEDAAKAYKDFAEREELIFVSGQASDQSGSHETTDLFSPNYLYMIQDAKEHQKDRVKFKGMVVHQFSGIQEDSASRLIELSGFRLGEFIPTIWELMPYSFIVDYFTNIGDILNAISALNAKLAWKSCSRWTSVKRETQIRLDGSKINNPVEGSNWSIVESSTPMQAEKINYSRFVPSLQAPTLVIQIPNSVWTWVNLAALLNQRAL